MTIPKPENFWHLQWHLTLLAMIALTAVIGALALLFDVMVGSFYAMLFLTSAVAVLAVITLLHESAKNLRVQRSMISEMKDAMKAHADLLDNISQGVKLSEAAKMIAYRDMDRYHLRATVMEKLYQQDFDATTSMIDDITRRPEYKVLGEELRKTVDKYRNSSEHQRAAHAVEYVDNLLDEYQWTAATAQIERLIKKYPDMPEIQQMRKKLTSKKELHKRQLLAAWDEAVRKEDTDRSLQVLKELDLYLTPSEGLALQEAASQIFKNKLHNMGVQFALAVTEKQWTRALASAKEIMREFPNSRMAQEVQSKLATLTELSMQ